MKKFASAIVMFSAVLIVADLIGQDGPTTRKASDADYKKLFSASKFDGKVGGIGPKSISVYVDDTNYQMMLKKANYLPEPKKSLVLKQLQTQYMASNLGKEFEFEFSDKVALRKTNIVFEYDERGNPKKYTPAELAKLKGEGNKPGYMAKPDEIPVGAPVTVYLRPGKNNRPIATMVVVNNVAVKMP